MSKEEFLDWKNSLATQEIFHKLKDNVYSLQVELGNTVGDDGTQDLIKRGYILAVNDMLNVQFEEVDA